MTGECIEARFRLPYPEFTLDVDLALPGRGVTVLFGHSGSGKTTLLRCIAGLERAPAGRLFVQGERWQDEATFLPAHRRPLGYVFQEDSLFPHLTARGNIEFGMKRAAGVLAPAALDDVIELLGIGPLLGRRPDRLSGGERQRVAIARALALKPRLLLMDEPLSALDLKRKREILPYLERLHEALAIPVLYVTHSPDEMARLADHLVLMEDGRVLADGPIAETLTRLDLPTARSREAESIVEATVAGHDTDDGLTRVDFASGELLLPLHDLAPGRRVRVRIHARDVSLALTRAEDSSILNILPATITGWRDDEPGQAVVRLDAGGVPLLARLTRRSVKTLALTPGKRVFAQVKSVTLSA